MKTILPPTIEDIIALAEEAMTVIPEELRQYAEGVPVFVEEFPDDEICAEMELDSPFDILGLYSGLPFGEKFSGAISDRPDMIFLFRRPILDYWCETGEDLRHVVRHVLIHEIGHHFGLSDEDMERIEEESSGD
jgi:predicted Zn-dependent protease with MMP-like domain